MEHGHTVDEIRARIRQSRQSGYLKDFVYGGFDGAVTTFAIVAGVEGAGFSRSVIIALGIANVLADGFSMAASNYTGSKAEQDNVQRLREIEQRHIEKTPDGEREEIRQILLMKGFEKDNVDHAEQAITSNKDFWIDTMLLNEYGVSPIKVNILSSALATFGAFFLCGIIPLLPFIVSQTQPFAWAIVLTLTTFFIIGAAKARWSLQPWWQSGLTTLSLGAVAAFIAYSAGYLVAALTG